MLNSISRPSTDDLNGYLLGTLSPAAAERVAVWIGEDPQAGDILGGLSARDTLTDAVAATMRIEPPLTPEAERIVRNVGKTLGADLFSSPACSRLKFGEYRVIGVLGEGGMGMVYEAKGERSGRRAAVKVLGPHLAADETARQRFLREGRSAAALQSPYVVSIYEVGEEQGDLFLAMERLEGSTLEDWLMARSGPATAAEVLWVAHDMLSGLAAAHRNGLVHRDIKPSNLWVERDTGRIKVIDCGLMRPTDGAAPITSDGRVVGTLEYMPPEQADGKPPDPRFDLFSAGVLLYRMASGRSPFRRDSARNTLIALATEEPPPLAGLPPQLSAFLARLMSKKPDGRPADADTALAEVQAIQKRLAAETATDPSKAARPSRRLLVLSMAAVAAAIVVAGTILVLRDKNGKLIVRQEVGEAASVEVIDTKTGKSTKVNLSAPKRDEQAQPDAGELRVGMAVRATAYTGGYADDTTDILRAFVEEGTKGVALEIAKNQRRCRVRLASTGDEVWILLDKLEPE